MTENKSPYLKGAVWIGLIFHLGGAGALIGILLSDAESFSAPRWIAVLSALMFFNAGFVVGLMDTGFNEFREIVWFSYFHGIMLLSIPLIFIIILNWVAFGPGEREFSGGISIPFLTIEFGRANEILGRIVFGIPALFFDVAIGYGIYNTIVEAIKKRKVDQDMDIE